MKRAESLPERGSATRSNQVVAEHSRSAEGYGGQRKLLRLTEPRSGAFSSVVVSGGEASIPNAFSGPCSSGRESAPSEIRLSGADSRRLLPFSVQLSAIGWCSLARLLALMAFVASGALLFTGCESTDGGGGGSVSGGMYYGTGFHDPWYYGGYYEGGDIIVTPPPARPEPPPRPSQPIARPMPAPRPMPSIPSAPRASFRR